MKLGDLVTSALFGRRERSVARQVLEKSDLPTTGTIRLNWINRRR